MVPGLTTHKMDFKYFIWFHACVFLAQTFSPVCVFRQNMRKNKTTKKRTPTYYHCFVKSTSRGRVCLPLSSLTLADWANWNITVTAITNAHPTVDGTPSPRARAARRPLPLATITPVDVAQPSNVSLYTSATCQYFESLSRQNS